MMNSSEIIKRLSTVEGHVRGIKNMVEENVYCIDVIHQIQAVQPALNKVNSMILEDHLKSCVTTAIQGDDSSEREKVIKELTGLFNESIKKM